MNIYIVLSILFMHWFGDFVLQTDYDAKNKSSSWKALLSHTATYSIMFFMISIYYAVQFHCKDIFVYFGIITFVFHTATDYYTSRINKQLWDKKDVHGFFVSVGFDQFLHVAQLLITFKLLS